MFRLFNRFLKKPEVSYLKVPTIDLFSEEPWLIPYVRNAIDNMDLPWDCSQELICEVKDAAFEAAINGWGTHAILGKLVPNVFKTKRDAKWAFSSLTIAGMSAVTYARLKMSGEKKFLWSYLHIPNSCIYEKHLKMDGKKYELDAVDWPSSKYLCRCMAQYIEK
jgi:hypothetical protein